MNVLYNSTCKLGRQPSKGISSKIRMVGPNLLGPTRLCREEFMKIYEERNVATELGVRHWSDGKVSI